MTSLKRILHFGWKNFSHSMGASAATIFVLVIVISLITSLWLFHSSAQFLVKSLEEKMDVNMFFKEYVLESQILDISDQLSKFSEVKDVVYITREQALEDFRIRHENDPLLIESLEELGANPFLESLSIRAAETSNYESIINFIENSDFNDAIEKVDYYEKKPVLDKIYSINSQINRFGIITSFILAIIAILIAFSQVRLSLSDSKEEISTMKLVGASNWFIKGPFIVQGAIIGFFSAIITALIFLGLLWSLNSGIDKIVPGLDIFGYFTSHFFIIFFLQLLISFAIGIFASLAAIKKYLKV